jgi:hypothetical protein
MLFANSAIRPTAALGSMDAHEPDLIPAFGVVERMLTARSREL